MRGVLKIGSSEYSLAVLMCMHAGGCATTTMSLLGNDWLDGFRFTIFKNSPPTCSKELMRRERGEPPRYTHTHMWCWRSWNNLDDVLMANKVLVGDCNCVWLSLGAHQGKVVAIVPLFWKTWEWSTVVQLSFLHVAADAVDHWQRERKKTEEMNATRWRSLAPKPLRTSWGEDSFLAGNQLDG